MNAYPGANVAISLEKGLWEIGGAAFSNISVMVAAGQISGNGSNGGADISAYNFVTHRSLGDLNWGLSIISNSPSDWVTNTVVYTAETAANADDMEHPCRFKQRVLSRAIR